MGTKVQMIATMIVATIWVPIAIALRVSDTTVMVGVVVATMATVGFATMLEKRFPSAYRDDDARRAT